MGQLLCYAERMLKVQPMRNYILAALVYLPVKNKKTNKHAQVIFVLLLRKGGSDPNQLIFAETLEGSGAEWALQTLVHMPREQLGFH
jgi:hypothetical protein